MPLLYSLSLTADLIWGWLDSLAVATARKALIYSRPARIGESQSRDAVMLYAAGEGVWVLGSGSARVRGPGSNRPPPGKPPADPINSPNCDFPDFQHSLTRHPGIGRNLRQSVCKRGGVRPRLAI